MPMLERAITIHAPVERVFDFVDDPKNLPKIWPSLYEIKSVKRLPNGGHSFDWLYNMAGQHLEGKVETVERVAYKRIVDKALGGIETRFVWTFQGENGTTKVKFEADYEVPPKYFPREEMPFVLRRNEFEADTLLANLKAKFEA